MNGFWYSVEPEDVLPEDVLSASDEVCHFRVQKAHEGSCVKLTKGMRFIWMVTPELAAENPKVGKRPLRWPFLECKRIVYARKSGGGFGRRKSLCFMNLRSWRRCRVRQAMRMMTKSMRSFRKA